MAKGNKNNLKKQRKKRKKEYKQKQKQKPKKAIKQQGNQSLSIFHKNRLSLQFPFEDTQGKGKKPEGWSRLPAYGRLIQGTRIIPLKTPLGGSNFRAEEFIAFMDMLGCPIGSVVDLNQSFQFYQPHAVKSLGVRYYKRSLPGGKAVASHRQLRPLAAMLHQFHEEHPDKYIAVHCSHGYNRTGLVICWYLCEYLGLSVTESLRCFAEARPPGIYRASPIEVLFNQFAQPGESLSALTESIGTKPSDVPGAPLFQGWGSRLLCPATGNHTELSSLEHRIPDYCRVSSSTSSPSSSSSLFPSSSSSQSSYSSSVKSSNARTRGRTRRRYHDEEYNETQQTKANSSRNSRRKSRSRSRDRSRSRSLSGDRPNHSSAVDYRHSKPRSNETSHRPQHMTFSLSPYEAPPHENTHPGVKASSSKTIKDKPSKKRKRSRSRSKRSSKKPRNK